MCYLGSSSASLLRFGVSLMSPSHPTPSKECRASARLVLASLCRRGIGRDSPLAIAVHPDRAIHRRCSPQHLVIQPAFVDNASATDGRRLQCLPSAIVSSPPAPAAKTTTNWAIPRRRGLSGGQGWVVHGIFAAGASHNRPSCFESAGSRAIRPCPSRGGGPKNCPVCFCSGPWNNGTTWLFWSPCFWRVRARLQNGRSCRP
ncbi:hypothetical protein B0T11DRAFT_93253 [Plectosphaerella cucumerina]|uniref:Uncharacterized protein n=1 Tax=Plectosphaerella cucumerina TaxID=40658 RepID=A0A8K0TN20_9PEZI|nr:hypothetical protein B0T11DRAFT_93253 [Plectosphaerella cucumerina]